MKVESIQLRSVTNFTNIQLNFNYQKKPITLIFGEQGTGKTTIIKCIYQSLTWFSARYKDIRTAGVVMSDQDITQNSTRAKIDINVCFSSEIGSFSESSNHVDHNPQRCNWQLCKTLNGNRLGVSKVNTEQLEQLIGLYRKAIEKDQLQGLPLIAYYPADRFIHEVNLLNKNNPAIFQASSAYDHTAMSYTTFTRFFEWFREITDIENAQSAHLLQHILQDQQNIEPEIDLSQHLLNVYSQMHAPHSYALKTAIETVLPDISNIELNFQPKLYMAVTYKGKAMSFQQLPNSIRNTFALVGDIVRRLCILNPNSLFPCLEGEGILLIDQINHHLDEMTASTFLSKLHQAFPHLQIIATTSQNALLNDATDFQCLRLDHQQVQTINTQFTHTNFDEIYNNMYDVLNDSTDSDVTEPSLNQTAEINPSPEAILEFIQQHLNTPQQNALIKLLSQSGDCSVEQNLLE